MQKIQVSASILSADMCNLEAVVRTLETSGTDMLHFDVMDGRFVDNISFGLQRLGRTALRSIWKARATHRKQLMPFMLAAFQQALSSSQIPQQRQSYRICPPWKWCWS